MIEHLLVQACLKEDRIEEAVPLIKKIVFTDPEYLPAQRLLAYSTSLTEYTSVAHRPGMHPRTWRQDTRDRNPSQAGAAH